MTRERAARTARHCGRAKTRTRTRARPPAARRAPGPPPSRRRRFFSRRRERQQTRPPTPPRPIARAAAAAAAAARYEGVAARGGARGPRGERSCTLLSSRRFVITPKYSPGAFFWPFVGRRRGRASRLPFAVCLRGELVHRPSPVRQNHARPRRAFVVVPFFVFPARAPRVGRVFDHQRRGGRLNPSAAPWGTGRQDRRNDGIVMVCSCFSSLFSVRVARSSSVSVRLAVRVPRPRRASSEALGRAAPLAPPRLRRKTQRTPSSLSRRSAGTSCAEARRASSPSPRRRETRASASAVATPSARDVPDRGKPFLAETLFRARRDGAAVLEGGRPVLRRLELASRTASASGSATSCFRHAMRAGSTARSCAAEARCEASLWPRPRQRGRKLEGQGGFGSPLRRWCASNMADKRRRGGVVTRHHAAPYASCVTAALPVSPRPCNALLHAPHALPALLDVPPDLRGRSPRARFRKTSCTRRIR